ncbi:MAG TPA: hypothetical protein VFY14_22540 [Streptomyces sp.]|nr:hypothetical protein [Streptomyces sp.]
MDLDALRFANFGNLNTAITDWSQMVTKLKALQEDAEKQLNGRAKKADWSGYNAAVTREFIAQTAKEFADAHTQASSIHNILKDTRDELVDYQQQLIATIDRGLKKNLTVRDTGGGGFTVTMNIHPDRAAPGTELPDHSPQDAEHLRDDVQRILSRATHSDTTAARVLRLLADQNPYGFSDASYKDRDTPTEALKAAEEAANLIKKKGDEMSPEEFDELSAAMARHKDDPLFQEKFATTLGPRKTLEFWADLFDTSDGGDLQRARLNQLGEFQKNFSITLAGATQSDSPAMQRWENDMVKLGDQPFKTRGARVHGFQVMSNLTRAGDYDDTFLNDYGNALVTTEKKMKLPANYWLGLGGPPMPRMNFIGDDFGRDPMTGFMTALANSPDASTEFFNTTKPQDNAEWVLKDRKTFDDTPLDNKDANHSREATGRALFAAASGISDPKDPNAEFVPHTDEHRQVLKRSLQHLAATGNDFPPEFRDDMARVLGNHGETVHRAMSDPIGSDELDGAQLMEVSKQISRNRDAYGILNEQMNYAIVGDIHTEKDHPEDSLDKAGRTIGFLEEARYQATNDEKDGDLTDASWKKNWAYHLVGGAANVFGGPLGDPLQRGVDVVATAWLEEEQKRINNIATGDHQETYRQRNAQLRALADEWYTVNKDWAEDPHREGYSQGHGVYSTIGAAANDGNQKAEGIAGDQ